jgi:hypothetical protein
MLESWDQTAGGILGYSSIRHQKASSEPEKENEKHRYKVENSNFDQESTPGD